MKTFKILLILVLFSSSNTVFSQNENSKWAVGLSLGVAKYTDLQGKILGGSFVNQSPRINISKYLFKNLTADAGFSTAVFDSQKYTTFDGLLKYDFGTSIDNVVPYVFIGGSFISALRTTPTLNLGAGNTFWIAPNYGINIQMIYKFSEDRFESQYSHFYPSVGIVYSIKPRNMNPRLWDMKH